MAAVILLKDNVCEDLPRQKTREQLLFANVSRLEYEVEVAIETERRELREQEKERLANYVFWLWSRCREMKVLCFTGPRFITIVTQNTQLINQLIFVYQKLDKPFRAFIIH